MKTRNRNPTLILPLMLLVALAIFPASAVLGDTDPASAKAQLEFGVKMAQRGLWQEALFRFKQANRIEPSSGRTLNNMAVAYEALGLFDKALEVYQEAVKIDPGNAELRQNYARFVDFYRNFRPDPADGEVAAEGDEARTEDAGS